MWEGIIAIPPPPEPPYDIETMEPIRVPALFTWAQEEESETIDAVVSRNWNRRFHAASW